MRKNVTGSMSKKGALIVGMLVTALGIGLMWIPDERSESSPEERPASLRPTESTVPAAAGRSDNDTDPVDASAEGAAGDLWKAFAEALRVERVAPEEDTRLKERSVAKKAFYQMRGVVRELSDQGLAGEALYEEADRRLYGAGAEDARRMLEGYRRLEEDLANADLDSMGPEDRFEYTVRARREAFGEETAENLFFEQEAYTQYKLEEEAITQATDLTEAEKRSEIMGRRNALQVELASRGSYVSFADERRNELDQRLRERYGDSAVDAMSEEERAAAVWALYREELPPEMLAKAEKVLAAQAGKRAAFEAKRQEAEAILNDEDLSFEQKQELLQDLSAGTATGG